MRDPIVLTLTASGATVHGNLNGTTILTYAKQSLFAANGIYFDVHGIDTTASADFSNFSIIPT